MSEPGAAGGDTRRECLPRQGSTSQAGRASRAAWSRRSRVALAAWFREATLTTWLAKVALDSFAPSTHSTHRAARRSNNMPAESLPARCSTAFAASIPFRNAFGAASAMRTGNVMRWQLNSVACRPRRKWKRAVLGCAARRRTRTAMHRCRSMRPCRTANGFPVIGTPIQPPLSLRVRIGRRFALRLPRSRRATKSCSTCTTSAAKRCTRSAVGWACRRNAFRNCTLLRFRKCEK